MNTKLTFVVGMLGFLAACGADRGNESDAAAGNAAQSDADSSEVGLIGTRWQWVSTTTPIERIEAADPARYMLRLLPEGRAELKFDCNGGGGSYDLVDNRLTFGPMMSTRMACPPDSQDAIFMRQLEQITTYFMQDGELFLEMPYDSGTMRFTAAAEPDA